MPFVMIRAEVQAAVPAGTIMVSPSAADATAFLISAREGLAALIILACTALDAAKSSAARTPNLEPHNSAARQTANWNRKADGVLCHQWHHNVCLIGSASMMKSALPLARTTLVISNASISQYNRRIPCQRNARVRVIVRHTRIPGLF